LRTTDRYHHQTGTRRFVWLALLAQILILCLTSSALGSNVVATNSLDVLPGDLVPSGFMPYWNGEQDLTSSVVAASGFGGVVYVGVNNVNGTSRIVRYSENSTGNPLYGVLSDGTSTAPGSTSRYIGYQDFSSRITGIFDTGTYLLVALTENSGTAGRIAQYRLSGEGTGAYMFWANTDGVTALSGYSSQFAATYVGYQDFNALVSEINLTGNALFFVLSYPSTSDYRLLDYNFNQEGSGAYMFYANTNGISAYSIYTAQFAAVYVGYQDLNSPISTIAVNSSQIYLGLGSTGRLIRYNLSGHGTGAYMFWAQTSGITALSGYTTQFSNLDPGYQDFDRSIVGLGLDNVNNYLYVGLSSSALDPSTASGLSGISFGGRVIRYFGPTQGSGASMYYCKASGIAALAGYETQFAALMVIHEDMETTGSSPTSVEISNLFISDAIIYVTSPIPAPGTYYVSPTGSNSNDGSSTAPWLTIQHSANLATAGSTVHVLPGTYNENIHTQTNGTSAALIVFTSDTQWGAKILGSSTVAGYYVWSNGGQYVQINNFDVSGTSNIHSGIENSESSYVWIQGNRVHDLPSVCDSSGGAGIGLNGQGDTNGQYVYAISNLIFNIGPSTGCAGVHGIYMSSPNQFAYNNIVGRVSGWGINSWHAATNLTIVNNTVFNSLNGGILIGSGDGGCSTNDYSYVANNLVYDNIYALEELADSPCTVGTHNNFVDNLLNDSHSLNFYPTPGFLGTVSGTQTGFPSFAHYLSSGLGDYHVLMGSPAVDNGTSWGAPAYDFSYFPRPYGAGFDIGAYEFH
jgi:hypothetical protein